MWIAKVKVFDKHCPFATRTKKFNISAYEYLLTQYKQKKKHYFVSVHILIADKKTKKKYIQDLKKDKRIKNVDTQEDLVVSLLEKTSGEKDIAGFKAFHNPEIIQIKPALVSNDGWENLEIGSLNREAITKAITAAKIHWQCELLKLIETKKYSIYVPRVLPKLTAMQKKAFELAVKEGYYQVPKKTSLRNLAKISRRSLSTYQVHLQKAEKKVMPDILSMLK